MSDTGGALLESEGGVGVMDENDAIEWGPFTIWGFGELPIWAGKANPQIILKFSDGVVAGSRLSANAEKTEFRLKTAPMEWKDHGVKDVHVDSSESRKSIVFIQMSARSEPLRCTKDYS